MTDQQISTFYTLIGSRIRELRNDTGQSQDDMAGKVGVSRSSIVNIEQGRQRLPLHLLWDIANELNVDVSALIPARDEILDQPVTQDIDDSALKAIEQKAQGNAVTRKKLIEFYLAG